MDPPIRAQRRPRSSPAYARVLPSVRRRFPSTDQISLNQRTTNMSDSQHSLTASDGYELSFRRYLPSGQPRGVVIGLHGIQSHSGWYRYSCETLAEAGLAVYFADRRGAGLNGHLRGHADSGMRLLHDVRHLYDRAQIDWPNHPMTLMGLSWGGKTAAAFAALQLRRLDRLVLLYPGLCPRVRPNPGQRFLLWFARTHDIRHKPVRIPLNDPALFTDNGHAQQMIRTDPLALHTVTSGFINAGRELDQMIEHCTAVLPPTLVLLAGRDQIIDNRATRRLLAQKKFESLQVTEYPKARHTLEFEPDRDDVFADLTEWILSPRSSGQP